MGGLNNKTAPLKVTQSTPIDQKTGVAVSTDQAALSKYTVNVRVFHPNKNFEKMGFRFHGDNRGFSLGESWFFEPKDDGVTSRIWQRYNVYMDMETSGRMTKDRATRLETESNFSGAGPLLWSVFSHGGQQYDEKKYKPRGTVTALEVDTPHGGQKLVRMFSRFAGENHAFITSSTQQDLVGITIVPTLDVNTELVMRVERIQRYIDIVICTYGDGFPNCESFIEDRAGNKLFLGTHVRIGYPSTHLWDNNNRLIWANAIRIEINEMGHFCEKLWVFQQILGGAPKLRDDYPASEVGETCQPGATEPNFISAVNFGDENRGRFIWNCGDVSAMKKSDGELSLPLYLSAFTDLNSLQKMLEDTWALGPKKKTTRTEWNNFHLHRDPNDGRAKEDPEYEVDAKKWQRA